MTNLHEAVVEALRVCAESNRRAEDAVREVTREAQSAREQLQAMARRVQLSHLAVQQINLAPTLMPKLHIPEVYYRAR